MQTVGNLGVAKKEFYSFRNIKYADSSNRFEVRGKLVLTFAHINKE